MLAGCLSPSYGNQLINKNCSIPCRVNQLKFERAGKRPIAWLSERPSDGSTSIVDSDWSRESGIGADKKDVI
jgi:hypothetical protein